MMNQIKAYYVLNMKMLMKDKLSFIWVLFLPSMTFVCQSPMQGGEHHLRFYWAYIIFSAYVFGIGLHALNLKEQGCLKTYFSIKPTRLSFFIANLLTQMTFSFVTLLIFNFLAAQVLQVNVPPLMVSSSILIIAGIPIAFLFYGLRLFKRVHYQSLNTLMVIATSLCLLGQSVSGRMGIFNPLNYLAMIVMMTKEHFVLYFLLSALFIAIGCYSIKKFSVMSNEVR